MNAKYARRAVFRSLLRGLILAGAILGVGCEGGPRPVAPRLEPELSAAQRQANIESFEYVWTTIRDKHFDPQLGGLNWQAIGDEIRPRVARATTMDQARAAMGEMIGRLGQSHFAIIPAFVYQESAPESTSASSADDSSADADTPAAESADEDSEHGTLGIDARIVDGQVLITSVEPDSPAAAADVKPGWIIHSIDGTKMRETLDRIGTAISAGNMSELILTRIALDPLIDDVGETIKLKFLDGEDRIVERELVFAPSSGQDSTFGNLPTMRVDMRAERIAEGRVGYIWFNIFLDAGRVMPFFNESVTSYMDADGIILDLRGNPGGLGAMAMGIGGWFVEEPNQHLGEMIMRGTTLKFVLNPRAEAYTGPLAILVDGLSASTTEILAGGLKDLGRARIFGQRTAGAALPSIIETLPNGDRFQYAFANYISAGGKPLEGDGVQPDVEVKPDRQALLAGRDAVIDAAVSWILAQQHQ